MIERIIGEFMWNKKKLWRKINGFFDFVCLWERGERNFPLGIQKQALKISIKKTFKKFSQIFELNKNAFKIAIKKKL